MKIRSEEVQIERGGRGGPTDGQTIGGVIVAFRNFANAPKSEFFRYLEELLFLKTGPSVGP